MITREATINDWGELEFFFLKVYRKNHPLHSKDFWIWQYGDIKNGRSFICLDDSNKIVGHVGANFGGGVAWIINVYLNIEYRGKGILSKLYGMARNYYPLAATAANEAGLGLYRNMRWIRYYDLVRYVKINPEIKDITIQNTCKKILVNSDSLIIRNTHYLNQPSIKGIKLEGNSVGISQENVGGLRVVDIVNIEQLEFHAWELGYLWMDYISSWNDLKIKELEKKGWLRDYKSVVPWKLNPLEKDYFCDITFLSEKSLDNEFVVHRSFSDHGRVGSINNCL